MKLPSITIGDTVLPYTTTVSGPNINTVDFYINEDTKIGISSDEDEEQRVSVSYKDDHTPSIDEINAIARALFNDDDLWVMEPGHGYTFIVVYRSKSKPNA